MKCWLISLIKVTTRVRPLKFGFAIQLAKSVNVTNCCQLVVYVHEVSTTTKGKDIVKNFLKKSVLDWGKLVGCTTDGAPSMLGRKSGFQAHVKAVSSNVTSIYCFLSRLVLPEKQLVYLNRVVKIVNFVKASALNTRPFKLRTLRRPRL